MSIRFLLKSSGLRSLFGSPVFRDRFPVRYSSAFFPKHGSFCDRHTAVNDATEEEMLKAMGLAVH